MNKILFITAFCIAGGLVIAMDRSPSPKIDTTPPRDRITCWQNHAVIDLPIMIPASYSEQAAEELRAIVCLNPLWSGLLGRLKLGDNR